MTRKTINGIQQVGIGVSDAKAVFNWYRKHLGFDILVFEDASPANLMKRYTGGSVHDRYALLALNMIGGGGLEIWQFKSREPKASEVPFQWGDLGINAMKIRCKHITKVYAQLEKLRLTFLSEMNQMEGSTPHFFFKDPWDNLVEVVSDGYVFCKSKSNCGGVMGVVIGVSDMNNSIHFYRELLGYDIIAEDRVEFFKDFVGLSGGKHSFRRVRLKHTSRKVGGFGELLGPTEIELLQVVDRIPEKIYKNRFWGDLGYIHLCFDISNMNALREEAKELNHPFKVDSADSFDMGDAAGHFSYVEDPDGTLIEFVETHKVPVLKKLGIYLNIKKRNPIKPLPKWLVRMMRVHRVKKNL